jgi:hypothetical protein
MTDTVIERFVALDGAFRERARRGERMYARFSALSCLSSDIPPETVADRSIAIRDELDAGLGAWKSPGKSMRLVFAAALAAAGRSAGHFFQTREALERRRRERGGRGLNHGGSCAALALVSAGGQPHHVDAFYDILEAIAAPWWRRDAAREEMVAAIFAAMGEMPGEALERLDVARQALRAAGVPKSHAEAAACEIAFFDFNPDHIAPTWTTLNTAMRGRAALRSGIGKTGMAVLAAHGDGQAVADALVDSFEAVRALKPKPTGNAAAKIAMRLAQAQTGQTAPISAARDLAAILAAQAAMIAAITASTATVAVTAAS